MVTILLVIYALGFGAFGVGMLLLRDRKDSDLFNLICVIIWPVILILTMIQESRGR